MFAGSSSYHNVHTDSINQRFNHEAIYLSKFLPFLLKDGQKQNKPAM
jgi:hypothetical protein